MTLRVERNYYHGATPSVDRDAGGRIRQSSFVEAHTEIDRETADCCGQCCTGLYCSPTRTTSQKIAKIGVYTITGAAIGGAVGAVGTLVSGGTSIPVGIAVGAVIGCGVGIVVVLSEDS
jgi:hypothetical protein